MNGRDSALGAVVGSPGSAASFTHPFAPRAVSPPGALSPYTSSIRHPSISSLSSAVSLPTTRGFPSSVANGIFDFPASPSPLPAPVVIRILAFAIVDASSLCELALVSKSFSVLTKTPELWRRLCLVDFYSLFANITTVPMNNVHVHWYRRYVDTYTSMRRKSHDAKNINRPVWQPDSSTDRCSNCHAVFTLLKRRHHCRVCGFIFCGACSSSRMPLPKLDYHHPVRVCDSCSVKLAQNSNRRPRSLAADYLRQSTAFPDTGSVYIDTSSARSTLSDDDGPSSSSPSGSASSSSSSVSSLLPVATSLFRLSTPVIKIVLIGHASVGKSSLVRQFVYNHFPDDIGPTVGAAFQSKSIPCLLAGGSLVKLQIWDLSGDQTLYGMAKMYYTGAAACILLYDPTHTNALRVPSMWIDKIRAEEKGPMVFALAGTKNDLTGAERKTSRSAAHDFVLRYNIDVYAETSARLNVNVGDFFQEVVESVAVRLGNVDSNMQ